MTVETQLSQLQALATGLCLDVGIQVELSDSSWAYDPIRRVILVARNDLQKRGPEFCAGILAHEVGHFFISRYNLFLVDFPSPSALAFLLNGIEDPRVNTWVSRRYPGVQAWIDLANRDSIAEWRELDQQPAFVSFCLACAGEYAFNWNPLPNSISLPPRVRETLDATRDARREYSLTLPPKHLSNSAFPPEIIDQFQNVVTPRLQFSSRLLSVPRREKGVCHNALKAIHLAEEQILPLAAQLLEDDLNRIQQYLERNPAEASEVKQAIENDDITPVSKLLKKSTQEELSEKTLKERSQLPLKIFEKWFKGQRRSHSPLISARDAALFPVSADRPRRFRQPPKTSPSPPKHATAPRPTGAYQKALQKVATQVEHLTRTFEQLLRPRRRLGKRSGYATGQVVDLRKLMSFEADPRQYNKIWTRKTVPERKVTAITLLIDLSGSMEGEKAEAALCGTVLLTETLSRIRVPFSVLGFQDIVLPFLQFGERLGPQTRERIGRMPMEISGNRPDGHNCPEFNDDGPCLQEAAEQLLLQPAYERILIAVSDGYPEGRRSSPEDLTDTIAQIKNQNPPITLIGVGLGPDTNHVKEFYPQSIAEVPVVQFAEQLGELLFQALRT